VTGAGVVDRVREDVMIITYVETEYGPPPEWYIDFDGTRRLLWLDMKPVTIIRGRATEGEMHRLNIQPVYSGDGTQSEPDADGRHLVEFVLNTEVLATLVRMRREGTIEVQGDAGESPRRFIGHLRRMLYPRRQCVGIARRHGFVAIGRM
jgi:hypothetical protein